MTEGEQSRSIPVIAVLVMLLPWLFCSAVAVLLLLASHTAEGRALALAFILAPSSAAGVALARDPQQQAGSAALLGIAALSALLAVILAPRGDPHGPDELAHAPGLQSMWLGSASFRWWGLPNLTPERDQFALGMWTIPLVDGPMDFAEARRYAPSIDAIYAELDAEPTYRAAGSNLGLAYDELLGGAADSGHVYADLAPGDDPQPVLLFLHGYGGPMKGYLWVLRKAAHDRGFALVAPSYGAGWWSEDEAQSTIDRTLSWMIRSKRFDMSNVAIAGLSNGGLGVTRALEARPQTYRCAAWISGVLEPDLMDGMPTDRPLLVLHGRNDDRVDVSWADSTVERLRAHGAAPTYTVVEDADHFLMLTHRPALEAAIGGWLDACLAADAPTERGDQ